MSTKMNHVLPESFRGAPLMAISGDYAQPVRVNGFTCRNCTDVDNAKKHIDPAHPKSGPYNVDAATDPTRKTSAIVFGGSLDKLNQTPGEATSAARPTGTRPAARTSPGSPPATRPTAHRSRPPPAAPRGGPGSRRARP